MARPDGAQPAECREDGPPAPRPYKGAHSYRIEDRHLFFGREHDAARLVSLILSERLCLLHAPSGAGKTSLLQAEVIPELEDRGWNAVRALPHNDPQRFLKASTLFRVLPDPVLEIEAIDRVAAAVAPHVERVGDLPLRELRRVLEEMVPKHHASYIDARRSVAGELQCGDGSLLKSDDVMPVFTRFTNAAPRFGPTLLARHVNALARFSGGGPWSYRGLEELSSLLAVTSVDQLKAFFARPQAREAHADQIRFLTDREYTLVEFFDRLCGGWGSIVEEFGLVLVLDQFEELFTRFVDQRHRGSARDPTLPNWELRPAYFAALSELLPKDSMSAGGALPIKIVVSMRDDYIAQIDQLEEHTRRIQRQTRYHLELLSAVDCQDVISKPAAAFNISYEPEVLDRILAELPTEQDKIEPSHIQIVCDRLYDQLGQPGPDQQDGERRHALITKEHLALIGDVSGSLERHFDDFLAKFDEKDRLEILDLLEPLMTFGGKRNIVEEAELLYKPFRRPEARASLLRALTDARIIRVEHRLNGRFVEITHEFLIASVQSSIEHALLTSPEWRDLRIALSRLERIEREGFRGASTEQMDEREYEALWWYRAQLSMTGTSTAGSRETEGRGPVAEDAIWLPELLLRTAVLLGRPQAEIRHWAELVDRAPVQVEAGLLLDQLGSRAMYQHWLDHLELRELVAVPPGRALDEPSARFVLASAVRNSSFALTRRVTRWVLEYSDAR